MTFNVKVADSLRIHVVKDNHIVQELRTNLVWKSGNKKGRPKDDEWVDLGYFKNVEQCINHIVRKDMLQNAKDYVSLEQYLRDYQLFYDRRVTHLREFLANNMRLDHEQR